MTLSGIWRFAQPLWDVPAATGDAAPVADAVGGDDEGSLSDHEAEFSRGAPSRESAAAEVVEKTGDRERNPDGTFVKASEKPAEKPRHRAKSQEASPDDVPRIAALTKRLREAEERAEAAERRAMERPAGEQPKPVGQPKAQPAPERFPKFETWLAIKGNEEKDFDDWLDAREDSRYAARRAAERAEEAAQADRKAVDTHVTAYRAKHAEFVKDHADFDDVIAAAPQVSLVMSRAVLEGGPELAYYLATHDEDREAIDAETSGVGPNDPAFARLVALTRRNIAALVAAEQRPSSSRAAAGETGAALALVNKSAPKPPTPVRTGALRRDEPSEDDSLDDHERRYGPKQKRA